MAHDHPHGHGHDHAPHVTLVHITAPGCHWSWGYEPVLQRLRLVYGDQVEVRLLVNCPYEDFGEWLTQYGMEWDEALAWLREEVGGVMGLPMKLDHTRGTMPWNVLPASLALVAAGGQGGEAFDRYSRVLTRRFAVEGQDVGKEAVLLDAAKEAGLDLAALRKALADKEGLRAAYEQQDTTGLPHLPLGFYNVGLTDGHGRSVLLDHAFDPRVVEEAIDYLAGGKLEKRAPTDVVGWTRDFGPTSAVEVARVFALTEKEALARLERGEKEGALERVVLADAPHWRKTA